MRLRDSGMPVEEYWESLFDVDLILRSLGVGPSLNDVAEVGCGFGTFTIPTAHRVSGLVHALDVDPTMVDRTAQRAQCAGLANVICQERDVMESGLGLPPESVDAVLLFNILHGETPEVMLRHAAHVLRDNGHVLVIHWRYDLRTPRGPSLAIRPRPEQIVAWAHATRLLEVYGKSIDLPPWHYGLRVRRLADGPAGARRANERFRRIGCQESAPGN